LSLFIATNCKQIVALSNNYDYDNFVEVWEIIFSNFLEIIKITKI